MPPLPAQGASRRRASEHAGIRPRSGAEAGADVRLRGFDGREKGAGSVIEIRVIGLPAPQGSKRHVGNGMMIESSKNVKPWREAVKWAALEYKMGHGSVMTEGAVEAVMVFTMPRPKSAKKGSRPSKKPDLSKLIRSTEDALTDAGAWEDDARVVTCWARKVFPGEHPDALDVPGAVIRIAAAGTTRP
jgi:Holliday junction resolvase RusA-like endonuclease